MSELYWITRLDSLIGTLTGLIIVAITIFILILIHIFSSVGYSEEEKAIKFGIKYLKIDSIILVILLVINAFIPTTKEALAIYGIGITLNYMQENKEVQQLPDKAVKCINLFLDKYIEEPSDKE